jgi:ribonuclease HII
MVDLYAEEQSLRAEGFELLAGVDEVGRGCLAGPVFAAAVILPQDLKIPQLNDSKKLSPQLREKISAIILQQALAYKIERVSVEEIDRINILQASLQAMQLAIAGLSIFPKLLLVDGNQQVEVSIPQKTVIQGDGRCASIAAASVIAKVARDRYMAEQEKIFPQFSFSQHKGYGTAQHLEELKKHGPTPLHRRSFAPVRDL